MKGARIALLGPPGCGKGTLARLLHEKYGLPVLATGDLLRDAIREETPLGKMAQAYLDQGLLVPDAVVNDLMASTLLKDSYLSTGFILDGYPRTRPQGEYLERFLYRKGAPLHRAFFLLVPHEVLQKRLSNRRICPRCHQIYHLLYSPPQKNLELCDHCSEPLVQRYDDRPEVVAVRAQQFIHKSYPLVYFYFRKGVMVTIDGIGTPEEILQRVEEGYRLPVTGHIFR